MVDKKLTDKQKLFVDYYVGEGNLNATRSARLAGYKGEENSLAAQGSRLLRNVKVREYIEVQLKDLALSQSEVLTILTRQAKASLADVLDGKGSFDLEQAKRRGVDGLLKKLKIRHDKEGTTYEYEMYDAQAAAVHLGKVHKLFTEKTEITGAGGGPLQINQTTDLSKLDKSELLQLRKLISKADAA